MQVLFKTDSARCRLWLVPVFLVLLCLSNCNADVDDGIGPRVPVPNVSGTVYRADGLGADLKVQLRGAEDALVVDSTSTDANGEFEFADVEPGGWEVKVAGDEDGDFDSVSREFLLDDGDDLFIVDSLDIWAYEAAMIEPADGVSLPSPSPSDLLVFRWVLPAREVDWARVQILDESGNSVWSSEKDITEEASWDGIGNEGDYDGASVPVRDYSWRVKMRFPDELEARLGRYQLRLQ